MDELCNSTFWNLNVTWYTANPEFTPCFRHTVMVWIPCGFLWSLLPLELFYLKKSEARDIPFNVFNISKLVLILITSLLKVADTSQGIVSQKLKPAVYFYSTMAGCCTLILYFILTYANIKRGIRSSGILFIFSFLSVICGIPEIKTIIYNGYLFSNYNENNVKNAAYTLYYICITTVFLMNCFADEKAKVLLCTNQKFVYPSHEASFLSKLFLIWFEPYVWNNDEQILKNYLQDLDSEEYSKHISIRKYSNPESKLDRSKSVEPSIMSILNKEHGFYFWYCAVLRTTFEVFTTGLFVIFDWLLSSLQADEPIWKCYFYTGLFFINILIQSIVMTKYTENGSRVEILVRNTVISHLYRKTLFISNSVKKKYSTSDIVNLMSVDTFQVQNGVKLFHFFLSLCTQMVISYLYLWYLLGNSIVASGLLMIGIFVMCFLLTKRMKQLQREEVKNKDTRSKFMQEIFSGIKVLKMYAWEPSFEKVALNLRQTESETLRKIAITNTMFQTLFQNSPFLLSIAAYVTYILITQNKMDVRITFVSFIIFNYFRIGFNHIPQQLLFLQQLRISIKRMNEFLNSEEFDDSSISHDSTPERLIMQNASFSWTSKEGPNTLVNMNIKIDECSLVAVVGSIGAGKSSLISAFLGEMYKISGYVNTRGKIAFVSQQAWILNTSIKENITLGDTVDEKVYQKVIEACALDQDLKGFNNGDLTEIGEKGINLSGGQKQRISLARAICQNSDIYFFDDPLSAVDSHVANHIFQNVISKNGILTNTTRIFVTHSTKFLPLVDKIILLKNGCVSEMDSYHELLKKNSDFADFIHTHIETEKLLDLDRNKNEQTNEKIDQQNKLKEKNAKRPHLSKEFKTRSRSKLINEEQVKSKQFSVKLYWRYFNAGGLLLASLSIFLLISFQISVMFSNIFLSKWVTSDNPSEIKYYAICGIIQIVAISLGAYLFFKMNVKAGAYFYHRLFFNILHWPMTSFDTTPVGRIISRIGDDIYTLDNYIALKMLVFIVVFIKYCSVFVYLIATTPFSYTIVISINILYFILRKYYVGISHQLKRIETINKSPLYSHLVETVAGIQTIRAFGLQDKFTSRCNKKNNSYGASYQLSKICTRWFCVRVEFLGGLMLCLLTTLILFERNSLTLGHISLQIAFTLQMIRGIAFTSEIFGEVEDNIVSVEKICEYLVFPQEPDWYKSDVHIAENWPDKGEIIFKDYKLRYRKDLDLVIKGISLTIKSGEKIGIVGRTGAGKTSIIQGLFRIVEPADGTIFIDNVDIRKVGLHILRPKLTVITQDPILFYGTLRFNLDPFENYQDNHLWDILEKSHLKNFVNQLPGGLYYNIDEGGQNLSFGQKQLICLARALLRKSKILILDEATASVDVKTDELIQKTIRTEFFDCTVITIAHRLNTLQDYDKIIVLDRGHVLDFDTAENLLNSSSSQFRNMVLESGYSASIRKN